MSVLWDLFATFFKIGLFTFGGGYAMIPLLQAELVKKKKWVNEEEIMDYYSIGQCTPGIIAVNVATFIGYNLKKIPGAIVATLGITAPSVIIILSLAKIIHLYVENTYVIHAFTGVRIVVIALILDVVLTMAKKGIRTYFQGIIFVIAMVGLVWLAVSPVVVVLAAAGAGLMLRG